MHWISRWHHRRPTRGTLLNGQAGRGGIAPTYGIASHHTADRRRFPIYMPTTTGSAPLDSVFDGTPKC